MYGILFALLVLIAVLALLFRGRPAPEADEPWRASLREDDEPLDIDEIRRAEEEWGAGGGDWEVEEGDEWRG